ncbi:MAG: SDR family oxidoreductase [Bacteroidota bacterium]
MKTVLITGASSGIGAATAKVYAKNGYNLILTARRMNMLQELKGEISTKNKVDIDLFSVDLSLAKGAEELYNLITKDKLKVDVLINNAGFGTFMEFKKCDIDREEQMLNLNILSLTKLTKLFVDDMLKLGGGNIINIASAAAFQSVPYLATYAASKAYVLSFSEAIAYELKSSNIFVTVVSPGATASEFADTAGFKGGDMFNNVPTSADLAEFIFNSMKKKKVSPIHGLKNNILTFSLRFSPRKLNTAVAGRMMK